MGKSFDHLSEAYLGDCGGNLGNYRSPIQGLSRGIPGNTLGIPGTGSKEGLTWRKQGHSKRYAWNGCKTTVKRSSSSCGNSQGYRSLIAESTSGSSPRRPR